MKGIIDWIDKNNTKKVRLFYGLVAVFCYVLMGTKIFWLIKDFDTSYMLDLKFFYSGPYFISTLADIPSIQAEYYQIIHYIDYIFIMSFYPLLMMFLLKNTYNISKNLIIIPITAMFCDLFENILIDFHLHVGISQTMGSMVGILSFIKFFSILITLTLIIYQLYMNWRLHHD